MKKPGKERFDIFISCIDQFRDELIQNTNFYYDDLIFNKIKHRTIMLLIEFRFIID